jgi:CRISPR-associated endonuclease/helicase Cas3
MPNEDGPELPDWLKQATEALRAGNSRIQAHPAGGVILFGPPTEDAAAMDLEFGDLDDDLSAVGQPVPLSIHTEHVKTRVTAWAARCLPPELAQTLITAAEMHDFGKVDPRFQIILYGDELRAGVGLAKGFLLAKSDSLYRSSAVRRRLQAVAGLPEGFRHEMLSLQLAEKVCDSQSFDTRLRDLALHVIAAHHGHARPFATVVLDDELPSVEVSGIKLSHEQRIPLVPPHRLDSGVAERFWTLTRRYGWWGLAYLEAILRLADRAASAAETAASSSNKQEVAR